MGIERLNTTQPAFIHSAVMDDIYKQNALFRGIISDELEKLDIPIEKCQFEKGDIVFEEGAEGRNMYLIASGKIRISKKGRGGKQETLTIKEKDDFFGEMALLQEEEPLRTARATAVETTVLGKLNQRSLQAMIEHSPKAAMHFTRLLASQLKSANTYFIDKLIDAERLSLIGSMMSAMVHDFRNPIASILMASDFLKSAKDDKQMVMVGEMTGDAANQMLAMIQEVLDYSKGDIRLNLGTHRVSDLVSAINAQILDGLADQKITVHRQIDYEGEIVADRNRLIRLLCNIVKNSAEAMPDGGDLTLRFSGRDDQIEIEIEDTGCGIPADLLPRIFEPFISYGKSNGTGLGMAIVKSVVNAHHGNIHIESEEGKGTICRISLPLRNESD